MASTAVLRCGGSVVGKPESPSALLRRAASLVRERAEKATPGPWRAHEDRGDWYVSSVEWGQVTTGINEDPAVADHVLVERDKADAEHVAGMDPLAGLALADLLETLACCGCEEGGDHWAEKSAALKFARLYLGEPGPEGAQP